MPAFTAVLLCTAPALEGCTSLLGTASPARHSPAVPRIPEVRARSEACDFSLVQLLQKQDASTHRSLGSQQLGTTLTQAHSSDLLLHTRSQELPPSLAALSPPRWVCIRISFKMAWSSALSTPRSPFTHQLHNPLTSQLPAKPYSISLPLQTLQEANCFEVQRQFKLLLKKKIKIYL